MSVKLALRGMVVFGMLAMTACAPSSNLINVRGQDVPTAIFIFFDKDSAIPQEESERAINEAAALLVQYDNTVARIVGHVAPDEELASDPDQRLDRARAAAIGSRLVQYGVQGNRIQPISAGRRENMSGQGGDASIDRRVDILFATRP
jgi:outer membrane protein OmpA-like peptidoglycan-associated protein